MNIVAPYPVNIPLNTSNANTESARRDNLQRETIPKLVELEGYAAEKGIGSESDRVKTPGQQSPQSATYEKPQLQQGSGSGLDKDNAEDPSAGKENAESKQQEQQQKAEEQEIADLKARDAEVRRHEQAHAAAGGEHAGAPKYEYESGPDGRQYAVGGEVSIDISEERSPEDTIRKMQQIRNAALAPSEPSAQDLRVASEATQKANEARADLATQQRERFKDAYDSAFNIEGVNSNGIGPDLDDIVSGASGVGSSSRTLSEEGDPVAEAVGLEMPQSRSLHENADPVAEAVGLETPSTDFKQAMANRDSMITQRALRIASFYEQVSLPKELGFQQSV